MFFTTAAVILFALNFLSLQYRTKAEADFCTKPACRKSSSDILSFIDPSIDPCRDFYKFTCGGLFKKTFETKPASLEAIVTKDVEDQINLMLSKVGNDSEPKAIRGLKKFFQICLDEADVEEKGTASIGRALVRAGGWPVLMGPDWDDTNFRFDETLIKLRKMGVDFMQLFYFGVSVGEREDRRLLISEPVIKNIEDKDKESYHDYMVDIAVILGGDKQKAASELQETLMFKMKLLKVLENAGVTNKTTIRSIQNDFPFLNWSCFINSVFQPKVELTEDAELYFPSTEYLKDLDQLLKEASNRTLANYILWEVIEAAEPYLPKKFRDLRIKHVQSNLGKERGTVKQDENEPRFDFCKNQARGILPPVFEALYLKEYFPEEKKEKAKEILESVKIEFTYLLNTSSIYDDVSRKKAVEKAEAIKYYVGAPDEVFDEELLNEIFPAEEKLESNDFLEIASTLIRQKTNFRLRLGSQLNIYYEQTVRVNAFYDSLHNTMVIPAAVLQGLFFNEHRPQYMNFGTIGTLVGHELTHGFTEYGSHYDKNGNFHQMWTNITKHNFEKKAQCFVVEATNFKIEGSNLRMDGRRTLEENTCDHTGVEVAYRAYRTWIQKNGPEKQLPGLTYAPKQLFWISAGSFFCDTVGLDVLKEFIEDDRHAHPTYRTFSAFSNSEHFSTDFNCTVGKRMNPFRKCTIF